MDPKLAKLADQRLPEEVLAEALGIHFEAYIGTFNGLYWNAWVMRNGKQHARVDGFATMRQAILACMERVNGQPA